MRKLLLTLAILIGVNCYSQIFTYEELASLQGKEHPITTVELLTEKGFIFGDQTQIDTMENIPGTQGRETYYCLKYGIGDTEGLKAAVFVNVDEIQPGNMSADFTIQIVYLYNSKNEYETLVNEIISKCEESPSLEGMYFNSDYMFFNPWKTVSNGEAKYIIDIILSTKEAVDSLRKAMDGV